MLIFSCIIKTKIMAQKFLLDYYMCSPQAWNQSKRKELSCIIKLWVANFAEMKLSCDFIQSIFLNQRMHHNCDKRVEKDSTRVLPSNIIQDVIIRQRRYSTVSCRVVMQCNKHWCYWWGHLQRNSSESHYCQFQTINDAFFMHPQQNIWTPPSAMSTWISYMIINCRVTNSHTWKINPTTKSMAMHATMSAWFWMINSWLKIGGFLLVPLRTLTAIFVKEWIKQTGDFNQVIPC